jgi:Tfp pilus assembly protein PilX
MLTYRHTKSGNRVATIGNERGVALIIVLVMLLLLTILGASMLSTSTSDLKISGNYRNSEESFYTADAALEIAQTFAGIYTNVAADSPLWPEAGKGKDLGANLAGTGDNTNNDKNPDFANYNRITLNSANGNTNKADVKVELLGSGNPPAGYGIQEDSSISPGSTSYKANYFAISVIAYGPNDTTAKLDSQLARIVQQ